MDYIEPGNPEAPAFIALSKKETKEYSMALEKRRDLDSGLSEICRRYTTPQQHPTKTTTNPKTPTHNTPHTHPPHQ
ncbi:hypothetical protein J6590_028361 [Homalodisca vitripennis]|nr:hypothetical protein J6590_028361 [Homalodisca vitripennis]